MSAKKSTPQQSTTDSTEAAWVPKTKAGALIPQTPGTGRKQCPACKYFVGPASEVCPNPDCGHEFVKTPKPEGGSEPKPKKAKGGNETTTAEGTKSDLIKLLSVLRGKGFDFKVSIDPLEENPTPTISGNDKVKGFVELINFDPKATTGVRIYDSKLKFEFLADLDNMRDGQEVTIR